MRVLDSEVGRQLSELCLRGGFSEPSSCDILWNCDHSETADQTDLKPISCSCCIGFVGPFGLIESTNIKACGLSSDLRHGARPPHQRLDLRDLARHETDP